jgi:hypothetical protein
MAKRVTIIWDDNELRRIASGPAYEEALRPTAEAIAERARTYAPVDSGEYRDSIRVVTGNEIGFSLRGKQGQRVRQRLRGRNLNGDSILIVAGDFKSHWIEYGTSRRPAIAPLRRAASEIAGRNYSPIPKGGDA